MSELKQIDKTYVANTYARFPVALISGKGSVVYDEDGKKVKNQLQVVKVSGVKEKKS